MKRPTTRIRKDRSLGGGAYFNLQITLYRGADGAHGDTAFIRCNGVNGVEHGERVPAVWDELLDYLYEDADNALAAKRDAQVGITLT